MEIKKTADCQFSIWINKNLHTEVKVRAAARNVTMARWISQAIVQRIAQEKRFEDEDNNNA
jgi:predicted HicB family RNase H-like nuclease